MRNSRWVCKQCDKKWLYPLVHCPLCKGTIEKQIGKKGTVIACTKVMIPTLSHPVVPYYIILLKDEHENLFPKKVSREWLVGEEFVQRIATTKDAVAVVDIQLDEDIAFDDVKELLNATNVHLRKVNLSNLAFKQVLVASQSKENMDVLVSFLLHEIDHIPEFEIVGKDVVVI